MEKELLGYDSIDISKPNITKELKLFLQHHPLPLGKDSRTGITQMVSSVGHSCQKSIDVLSQYMYYKVGGACPDDWSLAQKLILKGCEPLPRRRCSTKSVPKVGLYPFPLSLWKPVSDKIVTWSGLGCKNFDCLKGKKIGRDCVGCFDLVNGFEKERFVKARGKTDFVIDDVLALGSGGIRIGFDIGGGSGSFAARMAEKNVTVITSTLNVDAPFSEFIAARGLFPLFMSLDQRFPFYDNLFDLVHAANELGDGARPERMEFLMFDIDRILTKVYARKQLHLDETDYCKYDNQILTLFTSSLYFAGLISTFAASHVTRNKGRRISIIVGSISFFLGAVFNASAVNIAMLIIGRILLGIGIGFGNQAVPLYLSEMAPAKIRGAVNQLFQLTTCLGILIANLINYGTNKIHPWGWRLSVGLAVVPAILMFVGGLCLPETPNSLVEQGKLEEGRRVLERVRGTKNVDAELADLIDASKAAQAIKHPFRNLLLRKNRPQLVIGALGIPAFQQLTGMNSILFYAPVIFQSLGFGSSVALYSSIITNGMLVIATLVSMAVVDKLGRRFFFLEAGCQMITSMLVLAIILALKFGHGVTLPKADSVVLVIMICLFVLAYGWSWGPLGWLVPSELFPLETRSAGQSMVVCVNLFFTALIAQCFLVSLCHLRYGIFLLFAGLIFIMTSFIYFFLPETKQVPIEEISYLWQNHWFWKNIVETSDDKKNTVGPSDDKPAVRAV